MNFVEEIVYDGKVYIVLHKYESGFWELKETKGLKKIILLHETEILMK